MGGSLLIFLMNRITYKQISDLRVKFSKQNTIDIITKETIHGLDYKNLKLLLKKLKGK